MDKQSLVTQLNARLTSLQQQGIIDDRLRMCRDLNNILGPPFFLNLVPSFFADSYECLRNMTTILSQSDDVDFADLEQQAIKLLGSSGCIGACSISRGCSELRLAVDGKSKEGCILALSNIRREYHNLRSQMEAVLQWEERRGWERSSLAEDLFLSFRKLWCSPLKRAILPTPKGRLLPEPLHPEANVPPETVKKMSGA